MSTAEATTEAIAGVDLLVAGAPVHAFTLASEQSRAGIRVNPEKDDPRTDLSHPPLRTGLKALPESKARGRSAAFDTRVKGPFGHATKAINERLERVGYPSSAEPASFLVKGTKGPLRDGEIERASEWGTELARIAK